MVIGADYSAPLHVGEWNKVDEVVLGMYCVNNRNAIELPLLDFAKRMEIAFNTYLKKREGKW